VTGKRTYDSSARQLAAGETQGRILDAARKLFSRAGIDAVTIAEIGEQAGVAGSTIYSAFGSKAGILRALMSRAIFNADYERIADELRGVQDPVEALRITASVARSIYEGEAREIAVLRGASAFSRDLKKLEREFENKRYELQGERLSLLFDSGAQRPGLSLEKARDLMWMLTSRDVYRMLVIENSWLPADYEKWLAEALVRELTGR
jgi:AcrR family transcriptional regulator